MLACTFYFDGFGHQELNIIAHAGSWELVFKQLTLLTCKPCMNAPFYAGVVMSSKIWHIQWSLGTLCCYSDRMGRMGYTP